MYLQVERKCLFVVIIAHYFILIKAWCNFSWHQSKHNYSHINCTKGRFRYAIILLRLISSCKKCDDRTINHQLLCTSRYSVYKNNSSIWLNLYGIVRQSNYNIFNIYVHCKNRRTVCNIHYVMLLKIRFVLTRKRYYIA